MAVMVKVSVVRVLSRGIVSIVGDRMRGPLLESGQNFPQGLEGRRLLLQEPAQCQALEALLGQGLLEGLESCRSRWATRFWRPAVAGRSRRHRLAVAREWRSSWPGSSEERNMSRSRVVTASIGVSIREAGFS